MRDVSKWVYGTRWGLYGFVGEITRTVTTHPFGFTRVRTEAQLIPDTVRDGDKYVRALNGEPEPEVKLDDGSADIPIGFPWTENSYRFSAAALKAELVRRENADARAWPTSSMTGLRGSLGFYDNPPCERRTGVYRKPKATKKKGKKP